MFNLIYLFIFISVVSTLTGCGSSGSLNDTFAGRKVDYQKQSRTIKRLDVPPEMISEGMSDFMVVTNLASEVQNGKDILDTRTPEVTNSNVEFKSEGDLRYLVIHDNKKNVWDKVHKFWISQGFKITRETPELGILETDWLENKADLPQDAITKTLSSVLGGLYSTGSRDKYRVRMEDTDSNQTVRVFLTHYSSVEKEVKGLNTELVRWKKGPRDPELEVEMLGRLMLFWGFEEQKIKKLLTEKQQIAENKATILKKEDGHNTLLIKDSFPIAWRRMSIILDRLDFIIEDRNRDQGLFYLQYTLPKTEDSSVFNFWEEDKDKQNSYRIKLSPEAENTLVTIYDEKMNKISGKVLEQLNNILFEQLK
ncbi:MAG: outer membrane protein assembly factor BamC [Gammaproteobacteria bacterium]|nr:outer membrane protein assembly factor BamC [Gammaproteobacteria bacterium]